MQILLKNLLTEVEAANAEKAPHQIQIYCDMDGVLVDMDQGFRKLSGGVSVDEFKNKPEFRGDTKAAQRRFWQLINGTPNFWLDLPPTPDASILWKFITENFKTPAPVVLSAGNGASLISEKTRWIHKHFGPNIKVIISPSGKRKPEFVIEQPLTTHILIDDTQVNIDAWNNPEKHRIAILHKDAANTIKQLKNYIN